MWEDGEGGLVGVESHGEVGVTLQHCHTEEGGREGCKEKGQPMDLHKAACGKSCVKKTLKFIHYDHAVVVGNYDSL